MVLMLAGCGSGDRQEAATESAATDTAPSTTQRPPSTSPAATPATVDCAKPGNDVEKLVCTDPDLAALDRRVDELFRQALNESGADAAQLEAEQRGWKSGRDDCWKSQDIARCVLEEYQTRAVELQIGLPGAAASPTVEYRCTDSGQPVSAVFYNDIDPRSMVLTVGRDRAILFAQPTGSGIHYSREGADYAEHQGEVTIDFYGTKLTCTPA
ncbi:MliC family protein [Mycobacterium sp. Y57]|nr:MliC family protein [Mycolicibacterium xanthum]